MARIYVWIAVGVVIQLVILSRHSVCSTNKCGQQNRFPYWKHLRQQSSLFNHQNRFLKTVSGKFEQPPSEVRGDNSKYIKGNLQTEDSAHDVASNVKEFACPGGYRKRVTDGQSFCSPIFTELEILKSKESQCAEGQMFVDFRCKNKAQIPNQKKSDFNNKMPLKKSRFNELKSGPKYDKTFADKSRCEDGKVAAMSEHGYICMDPIFPPSVCPENRVPVITSHGIDCLPCPYGQTVIHVESGVKCEVVNIATTERPCPQGLQTVETPIGRICQYIPKSTRRGGNVKCPESKLKHVAGNLVCADKEVCPYGQIEVYNADGTSSCLKPEQTGTSLCLEGEILYEDACIPIHMVAKFRSETNNPCIPGHLLVVSNVGSVCQPSTDVSNVIKNIHCEHGTILKQAQGGFQCVKGQLPPYVIPNCDTDYVIAMLEDAYECISRHDANMMCAYGETLERVDGDFVCKTDCVPGEFYYIDKDKTRKCLSQHQASVLCGDGYVAIIGEDGFLCRKLREDVQCPAGFVLSLNDGKPLCIQEGENCLSGAGLSVTGCLYEPPHCQQGYNLNIDDVPYCQFVEEPLFIQPSIDTPCDVNGNLRPCDIPADLLVGCNPDCANGGTCINNMCHCPPGISGHACHIDLDECTDRPCQYGCDNTFGSYRCTCPGDMVLSDDGKRCADKVCIPDCLNDGECVRGRCRCTSGFEGNYCQIDKDECMKYGDRLCQYRCRNTYGSYNCICPPGSSLNPDGRTCLNKTCIPACRNGGSCREHRCYCPRGFYGIICQFDVNECRKQKHQCSQICVNTWGSYVCSCKEGYNLHTDGRTCIEVVDTVQ